MAALLRDATDVPRRLTLALVGLMSLQPVLGLLFPRQYRDVEWIRATWYGNDWVTLLIAVPLLLIGHSQAISGSARGVLLWLGAVGYAFYNYAFYLFGAALNAFFPLYVALLLLSSVTLIMVLPKVDVTEIASRFRPPVPPKLLGGYFVVVGLALGVVWIGMWAAYVFFGRPTPVEPDAFQLVAALDLSIMIPLLVFGGALTWCRAAWAPVVSAIAGVQSSLYLLVLSVNAIVAISWGLVRWPGELPWWGTLFVCTSGATILLITSVGQSHRRSRAVASEDTFRRAT